MKMIVDVEKIEKLLADENISAYEIEKYSGLNRMTITNLRNGNADLMRLGLGSALKLMKYIEMMEESNMEKWLGNFGDYDLKILGNEIKINFHENVNRKSRTKYLTSDEISSLLNMVDEYDEANDMDERESVLFGINDLLGI